MSNSAQSRFLETLKQLEDTPEFRAEQLLLNITEEIVRLMEEEKVGRSELARRLGVHRQFITRILNGTPNMTLLTLIKVATALKARIDFQFVAEAKFEADSFTLPAQPKTVEATTWRLWSEPVTYIVEEDYIALPNAA